MSESTLSTEVPAENAFQANARYYDTDVDDSTQEIQEKLCLAQSWAQRIQSLLSRVGSAGIPVLLRGETGVGKEVIARQLHAYSKRANGPFVKVNCAALPSELVESELFGYEKGAFTGAFRSTPGRFEMANRGTILLDEIGDMDLKLQAKLLQVLQDQEFHRLGASRSTRVDVRIMAASHCNFEDAISKKRFREDLFYRLNIVDVKIPPLRERRSEILPLCEIFLERHATPEWPKLEIPPLLGRVLLDYSWPGNVRELENLMRKYLVLRSSSMVTAEIRQLTVRSQTVFVPAEELVGNAGASHDDMEDSAPARSLPIHQPTVPTKFGLQVATADAASRRGPALVSWVPDKAGPAPSSALSRLDTAKKAAEAEAILSALNSTMWNRKRAAGLLNIDYKALLYKMKKLGICEERIESVS
jgi:transcriptional regulator with PAS, ATPase and Fis domain